jgi:hypothetical protein
MNGLVKRIDRLERGGGDAEGIIHYITAPRDMASEEASPAWASRSASTIASPCRLSRARHQN